MRHLVLTILGLGVAILLAQSATAQSVEVRLSDRLERLAPRLNAIEQRDEKNFRRTGLPDRNVNRSVFRFNRSRTRFTEWAGEELIPDADDYTLDRLIRRLVEDNLVRAGITPDGTIRITLETLRLTNHPLAAINGANIYAAGKIELVKPNGAVVESHQVSSNFAADFTVDLDYEGPKYAFLETDQTNRIGPIVSEFVEDALTQLYPNQKSAFEGPILVRLQAESPARAITPRY